MPISLHQSQEPGPSPSLPQIAGDGGNGSPTSCQSCCGKCPTAVIPNLGLTAKDLDEGVDYFAAQGERARLAGRATSEGRVA
jgi:hypothetical protein